MSEVKRYSAALTHAETSPMYETPDGEWVVALDFDRVTAERDALQLRLNAADQRIDELEVDAGRYKKLQLWMASNVKEGWQEVERLGGICAWMSCDDMDQCLDALSDCNVGLCEKPTESGAIERKHEIPGTSGKRLNMLANQGE